VTLTRDPDPRLRRVGADAHLTAEHGRTGLHVAWVSPAA
jgi:hypothetical protein